MANALHTPGVVDSKAARLDDGGLLALQGPGALDVRTGVLVGPGSTALVTGTSSTSPMRYSINPNHWVASRSAASGPYRGTLEATQLVDTTAAPGTGSRIDVIWAKQQDNTVGIPSPDGTAAEQYGCTQGTATTGTPTKPPIPVGAVELATGTVSAGATSTNGSGVTITQTARQTVARGAPIPVRNQAERDAYNSVAWPGLRVIRLDLPGYPEQRWVTGTTWTSAEDDTGWTSLTLASPLTGGNSAIRRVGSVVDLLVEASWSGVWPSSYTVTTIPNGFGFRPPRALWRTGNYWSSGGAAGFRINPDGTVVHADSSGTTKTGIVLGATWTV